MVDRNKYDMIEFTNVANCHRSQFIEESAGHHFR